MKGEGSLWSQRLLRGGVILLFFVIPFSNAAIELLFPLLLMAWCVGWLSPSVETSSLWRRPSSQQSLVALLGYLAICTWSVYFSSQPILSLKGLIGKTFEYALFFIIVSDAANHPLVGSRSTLAWTAAAWLIVIHALIQEGAVRSVIPPTVGIDPILHRELLYGRMTGPYRNPNDLATYLMVTTLVLTPRFLQRSSPGRTPIAQWCLAALLLGCLAWTQSRGALLGFLVGAVVLVFLSGSQKWMWRVSLAAIGLTTGLLFLKRARLMEALTLVDPPSLERRVMWETGWRMVEAHPFTGVGLNAFMANYLAFATGPNEGPAYAHNCFLQIAAETGMFGLMAFLGFLGATFFVYYKAWRALSAPSEATQKAPLVGLVAGLTAYLVQSAFDTNLYALRQAVLFWALAGLTFGTAQYLLSQKTPSRP